MNMCNMYICIYIYMYKWYFKISHIELYWGCNEDRVRHSWYTTNIMGRLMVEGEIPMILVVDDWIGSPKMNSLVVSIRKVSIPHSQMDSFHTSSILNFLD